MDVRGVFFGKTSKHHKVYLKWFPDRYVDNYKIYIKRGNKKIYVATNKPITAAQDIKKIKSILQKDYSRYKKLSDPNGASMGDARFVQLLANPNSFISFMSIYDERLCEILGTRFIHYVELGKHPYLQNTKFYYIVEGYRNNRKVASAKSNFISLRAMPVIPKVRKLSYSISHDSVEIKWRKVKTQGIIGYNIYLSEDNSNFKKINQRYITFFQGSSSTATRKKPSKRSKMKTQPYYRITSLKPHQTYYVKLTAVTWYHVESQSSKILSFEYKPLNKAIITNIQSTKSCHYLGSITYTSRSYSLYQCISFSICWKKVRANQ